MNKIFRFMKERELSMLLNGEFVRNDSNEFEDWDDNRGIFYPSDLSVLEIGNLETDYQEIHYLVEFEVINASAYKKRLNKHHFDEFDEYYVEEGYSIKDFRPIRISDNIRDAIWYDYYRDEFPPIIPEDINWIDAEGKTYHDIKKIKTANEIQKWNDHIEEINEFYSDMWWDDTDFDYSRLSYAGKSIMPIGCFM